MTAWRVVLVAMLLAGGIASALAQGGGASAPTPAWSPRVDYDCNGAPLSVWYEPKAAVLFIDGRLETLRQVRSGSGARYMSDRREWFTKGAEGLLGAVKQSAATQLQCRVTATASWRPHLAPHRYSCADGLTIEMAAELEWATFSFRGETMRMREVRVASGTLFTDGVRAWRGPPNARLLAEADGDAVFARGCHPGEVAAIATIDGTVAYRTRQALSAGAVIEVRLVDVSNADAPAVLLARQVLVTTREQVPVPFALTYAPEVIEPGHRYQVQATITIDGRVRFRTTTAHPVFEAGARGGPVAIVVQPAR